MVINLVTKKAKKHEQKKLGLSVKELTQLVKKQKLEKIAYNPQTKETKTIDISKPFVTQGFFNKETNKRTIIHRWNR